MDRQMPHIPQLELRGIDKSQTSEQTKRTINVPNNRQNLAKLYLNKEILSECLQNFDLFKEMLGDPIQKIKIIRDISKALRLKTYDQDAIIYNKGENSTSIYMVIKGNVSLCIPIFKESQQNPTLPLTHQRMEFEYQEIDMFKKGQGFGQAQFIHGKKRSLIAKAKQDNTVIALIDGKDFEEVIQLYKQRVYFKKIQMFGNCPLLHNLFPHQLQFIVNNAKPFVFTISKQIVKSEQRAKALYLITEGQVELRRINDKQQQKMNKYSTKNKITLQDVVRQKIKIKNIVVGVLQEGGFLGDGQIALDTPYNYSAICKSQKVRAYICDERIILSQMTEENFKSAKEYYLQKKQYRQNKSNIYQEAKHKIQKRIEDDEVIVLDKNQMKIKRMISNRYVEKRPSLIDQMSPRDIGKIVEIKYSKLKQTLNTDQSQVNYFPNIHTKSPFEMLRADHKTYSPLLKRSQIKQQRKYSQNSSPSPVTKSSGTSNSLILPYHHQSQKNKIPNESLPQPNSLLVLMQPFHRKVQSLHQRLAKEYNNTKKQKQRQLDKISAKLHNRPQVQLRRMSQFINKIKQVKKR